MMDIRRSEDRGHADHGWLDARHTFSFAGYVDPRFTRFGVLRVLNQDRIAPGKGFDTHGHENMEIVTYVLEGALEHKDSMGNGSQIQAGEVQIMSAGSGVLHSEFNASDDDPVHLLQMWLFPRERGTAPRYGQRAFPPEERANELRLVVSPDGQDGSLMIDQDARLYVGDLAASGRTDQALSPGRSAWIHVASGRVRLNERELGPGDGAGIRDEQLLSLEGVEDAQVVLWDLPSA